jgi:Domain of unknown function (DUF5658)
MTSSHEQVRSFLYCAVFVALIAVPSAGAQDDLSAARVPASQLGSGSGAATIPDQPSGLPEAQADDPGHVDSVPVRFDVAQLSGPPRAPATGPAHRPAALIPLYSSFAALQVLDVHSTWQALNQGAREVNPMVAPIAGTHGFPLLKVASTTATIIATERIRKRHPRAAVVVMIAANSAYAMIVAHNYAITRQMSNELR